MNDPSIRLVWDGHALYPVSDVAKRKCAELQRGRGYSVTIEHERSRESHGHYFAVLNEAWQTLPAHYAGMFPNPEALRKFCLVASGFFDCRDVTVKTPMDAARVAAFVKPLDPYAIVTVTDCVVSIYTAQSQSVKAMGKKRFQASKEAVLQKLAIMCECNPEDFGKSA